MLMVYQFNMEDHRAIVLKNGEWKCLLLRDLFYGLFNESAGVGFFLTSFIPGPWNIYWLWNGKCEQLWSHYFDGHEAIFREKRCAIPQIKAKDLSALSREEISAPIE